ncbi:MAG TPA: hypothetical protein VFV67_30815 [Actinophytocola sp.]|uniref:hypothetical protein n=1 Tax=Actinophytocola sp. TaxID=1872138 RepID=UPI002DB7B054|nr:hypothetical protein [Actinophytocola sp.]HEU5475058.1 hypothetical protein [Actinophytocola sp.]
MAHQEQFDSGVAAATDGISRRKLIVTGGALAAAGVAVGAAIPLVTSSDGHAAAAGGAAAAPTDPVMVHMRDANSGQFDLFIGERRASFTDRALAAQLARAAADAS